MTNICFLNGNYLKIIAAFTMFIDHTGYILFPEYRILRIIGRTAFPVFAFMISEGCHYTKNKFRYFMNIFILGVVCQIAYFIFDRSLDMGVLVTFSLSILTIYSLQNFKKEIFSKQRSLLKIMCTSACFIITVASVYIFNLYLSIDYSFWGCMLPVFASIFRKDEKSDNTNLFLNKLMFVPGLIILALNMNNTQFYSLQALPFIFLYSGKRGKINMKYFFYIFYPAHLVLLQIICTLRLQ